MIQNYINQARALGASDLHLAGGCYPMARIKGELCLLNGKPLQNLYLQTGGEELIAEEQSCYGNTISNTNMEEIVKQTVSKEQLHRLQSTGEIDFSLNDSLEGRCRVNIYKQNADYALAVRLINEKIPSCQELGIPMVIQNLMFKKQGLILITGSTGAGKSTTMASLIQMLNNEQCLHIVTLEEPVEYRFQQRLCMINQREIGRDTQSFASGLRSSLREDPDVILVGELRDPEALTVALQAAETGHLVISTLHTRDAVTTINRILDMLPERKAQLQTQLADCLLGIVSQMLLKRRDGSGRIAAWEILLNNNAVSNLIREGRNHQIHSYLETSSSLGMQTMAAAVKKLKSQGIV